MIGIWLGSEWKYKLDDTECKNTTTALMSHQLLESCYVVII
jgi:hypothetical protein